MNREVVPKVKIIVNSANEIAKDFEDKFVRPEHILLAIINDKKNNCVALLSDLNIDLATLFDDIMEHLNHTNLTPVLGDVKKLKVDFSPESKLTFKLLSRESEGVASDVIDTSHILLSMLTFTKWGLVRLLRKHNLTYKIFKDIIMKNNNGFTGSFNDDDEEDEADINFNPGDKKKKIVRNSVSERTPVLDKFCRNVSEYANEGKIDPVVGRKKEIKRISQILARRKKNNPILIGDAGVGKTAIVEGLAILINEGKSSRVLLDKKIYALDLSSIVAGTKYRGQFEERMKAILEELKNNRNIILFIDEFHTIVGTGNASGSMDAANIFKPALGSGEIQVIGATTPDEFRENIESDTGLTRRFQRVNIEEPSIEETRTILNNIKGKYEKHHRVSYTEDAINECVRLSDRYISDRAMPDKAIDVLDEVGATTNVDIKAPDTIKNLEQKNYELDKEKLSFAAKQDFEEAAKIRDEQRKIVEELDKKKEKWLSTLDEKRTIIDGDLVAEVVSMMTGIPVNNMSTEETKKLINMDKDIKKHVIGQDRAIDKVVKAIKRNRLGIKDKSKPIGSFIFLGPTGVGKTHLAKALAENLFGSEDALIRLDMSEYMEKFAVSSLIGPPPGYVGYEEGGHLTEKVRKRPYSVVLFDEIEKAHEDIFNVLLQLLDDGQLTDGLGRTINFKNCLVIMTSNIGVSELSSFGKNMGFETGSTIVNNEKNMRSIIDKALKKKFKPEFLNRLDDTIIFNNLSEENIHKIIYIEIANLKERVLETGYKIKMTKSAIEYVATQGYDVEYGARELNRAIQRCIEEPIADRILSGKIKKGDTISITYNKRSDKIILS
tara:strand:- start:13102 stop:15603 length:2502 start_codon:yes stop_codon:yes gene_type:complete